MRVTPFRLLPNPVLRFHSKKPIPTRHRFMMAQHGHSKACCNIPPIVAEGYEEKGSYIDINGMKTYATGPASATSAILIVYDIFGLSSQAKQGADILAHADSAQQYQVFMPDLFLGEPAEPDIFPPDTEEKKKRLGAFFEGPANPPKTAGKIPGIIKSITEQKPNIQKWCSLGVCWGGKIVSLTSGKGTPFSAAAEVHPAMVDPNDAKDISIPLCMLASKDEDSNAVKAFGEALTVPNYIETFDDQIHGWMGARADLQDDRARSEYERGYKTLLEFYHQHL